MNELKTSPDDLADQNNSMVLATYTPLKNARMRTGSWSRPNPIVSVTFFFFLLIEVSSTALCQDRDWEEELSVPPKEIAELIERGKVSLSFYDQRPSGQRFEGETRFQYDVRYRFRFRLRGRINAAAPVASVTISSISIVPQNKISVPSRYTLEQAHEQIWTQPLIVHEFEHVKINSDPRLFLLLRAVVASIRTVPLESANSGGGQDASSNERMVSQKIDEEIDRRVAAVTALVQANNDLLDQVTRHGVVPEYRDSNFFNRLYMEENLKDQNFPYVDSLKVLLKSKRYTRYAKVDAETDAEDQTPTADTSSASDPDSR